MTDFNARFSAGTTLEPWLDPASGSRPTRLNPLTNQGHVRRVGSVGVEIEVTAEVGGVDAPLDGALGARTFFAWFAEHVGATPVLSTPVGQSSVQRFTPLEAGHYTFALARHGGGGTVVMHLDVQEP